MTDGQPAADIPAGIAWLDLSVDGTHAWPERVRIGPLGMHVEPLDVARQVFYFKGARLRGGRCLWAAASVNGALLTRAARTAPPDPAPAVQLLMRAESSASVFDPGAAVSRAVIKIVDPFSALQEAFRTNSHLCTLSVHASTVGLDPPAIAELVGRDFAMNAFQLQLIRSMVPLLLTGNDVVQRPSTAVGVDRFLGAFAGLLLRTIVAAERASDSGARVRERTEEIIDERATDPMLTPASIAAELRISLRQLYRAFTEDESPAALIRRRRLERAMQLLVAPQAPGTIEAVAAACGFASAEYFSRAFRREYGLSPRAYRAAHRDVPVGR